MQIAQEVLVVLTVVCTICKSGSALKEKFMPNVTLKIKNDLGEVNRI